MVSSSELDGFDISSQIDFIEEVLFIFLIIQKTLKYIYFNFTDSNYIHVKLKYIIFFSSCIEKS